MSRQTPEAEGHEKVFASRFGVTCNDPYRIIQDFNKFDQV